MPVNTPDIKVANVRKLGGQVELVGESYQVGPGQPGQWGVLGRVWVGARGGGAGSQRLPPETCREVGEGGAPATSTPPWHQR